MTYIGKILAQDARGPSKAKIRTIYGLSIILYKGQPENIYHKRILDHILKIKNFCQAMAIILENGQNMS